MIVVVFSCSDFVEDITRAYSLGANSYIVKPTDPEELVRVVERLESYWSGIKVPANPAPDSGDPAFPAKF
jgi:DNA-binding response OmpR family regulator